jgi:hypothetical protein
MRKSTHVMRAINDAIGVASRMIWVRKAKLEKRSRAFVGVATSTIDGLEVYCISICQILAAISSFHA